ncbi:preprotein translocase subunit SecG [Candidatus Similichlamydia epinepheli]|uniref:preprotein translocase subunit SecG n=1 Tax=Candidatus Similichlamydia epinepheli TaxID=1903953 RepID=UPI000D39D8B5|nr:preprotein translocase subunit SecG [Candidatus Similichlamydia epinepheli]
MFLDWSYPFCLSAYLGFVVFLCCVILLQESRGGDGGLGGVSVGGNAHLFLGTSAAQVLRKVTSWSILFFLTTCVFLSVWTAKLEPPSILDTGQVDVVPPQEILLEEEDNQELSS